jgi:hypothetical protein
VHELTPRVVEMVSSVAANRNRSNKEDPPSDSYSRDSASSAGIHWLSSHPLLSEVYLLSDPTRDEEKGLLPSKLGACKQLASLTVRLKQSDDSESRWTPSVIRVHDVWLQCLKVAVNLSHKSPSSILAMSRSGIISDVLSGLQVFSQWRQARATKPDNISATSKLSSSSSGSIDPALLDVRTMK